MPCVYCCNANAATACEGCHWLALKRIELGLCTMCGESVGDYDGDGMLHVCIVCSAAPRMRGYPPDDDATLDVKLKLQAEYERTRGDFPQVH